MLTTKEANDFARDWISAWNAHDLALILKHYWDDVVFSSPFVKRIANDSSGLRSR
jgi:ketosteroid isomerase-like protein